MVQATFLNMISVLFGAGGLVLFVLAWIRFKSRDRVDVEKLKAEAVKVSAEAQEIRAKADVLITDGALRIVERLSKDLDEARDEIEKLLVIVAELKTLHEKAKIDHQKEAEELHNKIKEASELIETKRRHCMDIKSRIMRLQELLLLKQSGLSQEQFTDFINQLNELINSDELTIDT